MTRHQSKLPGPADSVLSLLKVPDDSSSRSPTAQDRAARIASQSLEGSVDELALYRSLKVLSEDRNAYDAWILGKVEGLSSEGRRLVETPFFDELKRVPNSTVAHSKVFSHIDVTRWDHCIHAAGSVKELNRGARLGLTPYECKVLELVMLLHDPHRLGSHALDRVFASMPGAPANFKRWWAKDDYHEYHGAKIVAADPEIKRILGKYRGDVFAILAHDDKRSAQDKAADYGVLAQRLRPSRINALFHLKDELDRCSYLKLDFLRSGYKTALITEVFRDVELHERTLSARGAGMQINIEGASSERPYDNVASWRHKYRADIATLPIGCLAEKAVFHDGVWEKARERFSGRELDSRAFYEFVRDSALRGDYSAIYSNDALTMLRAAKVGEGLSVEDVYAPLVTMTLADLTESVGQPAIEMCVAPIRSEFVCGVPRRDMTIFEAEIREALQQAGLDSKVHVLMSNDFKKTLIYSVSHDGNEPEEKVVISDCHPSLIKVIVAARAIDHDGNPIDLSPVRDVVCETLRKASYLTRPEVLNDYNPLIFARPMDDSIFRADVSDRIKRFTPAWIKLGGSGLIR